MRPLALLFLPILLLLAGCANPGAPPSSLPNNTTINGLGGPSDNVVGTPVKTIQPDIPPAEPVSNGSDQAAVPMPNNSTTVTSGSGGQIVDVGGSIPVQH